MGQQKADVKNDEVLDVKGLSALLKVYTPDSIRELAQAGKIPCYKPGKSYLFFKSEILTWIAAHPIHKTVN